VILLSTYTQGTKIQVWFTGKAALDGRLDNWVIGFHFSSDFLSDLHGDSEGHSTSLASSFFLAYLDFRLSTLDRDGGLGDVVMVRQQLGHGGISSCFHSGGG
jgi:hypothetical protein